MAFSARILSSVLICAARLQLKTGLSCNGVSCILNSAFIPMSKQCPANISWNSTSSVSTACLASGFDVESVQLKLEKNWVRDFMLFCGINCFFLTFVIQQKYVF